MCLTKIFIYELEPSFRDPAQVRKLKASVAASDACNTRISNRTAICDVGQFALGSVVWDRLVHHPCRTENPSKADLFFIGAFSARFLNTIRLHPTFTLAQHLNMLTIANRTLISRCNGLDHFIIQPRNGAPYERTPFVELDYTDVALRATRRLAIETPMARSTYPGTYHAEPFYFGVPYPSGIRGGTPWKRALGTGVAAGFGMHGAMWRLRHRLRRECRVAEECTWIDESDGKRLYGAYERASLCLQPPGDSVTRRGVIDAILLGCLPVLFHEGQASQWPWHFDWAHNASIVVTNHTGVLAQLRNIPRVTLERKHRILRKNAWKLVYRLNAGKEDALSIILNKLHTDEVDACHNKFSRV